MEFKVVFNECDSTLFSGFVSGGLDIWAIQVMVVINPFFAHFLGLQSEDCCTKFGAKVAQKNSWIVSIHTLCITSPGCNARGD